jgi:hypothetical protein
MSNQEHPGMITFVNEETNTVHQKHFSEFEEGRWMVDGIPVVKVVFIPLEGNRAKVCHFSADGRLLQTSVGTTE